MYLSSLRSSERGLKSELANDSTDDVTVAPFVGAWIEIKIGEANNFIYISSLRSSERGLK